MDESIKTGVFEGRAAYEAALRQVLLAGCAEGSRAIVGIAPGGFMAWPWSDRAVLEALAAWARRGRMLQLIGTGFEELRQRHPRFVQWRTTYDHCFEARELEPQGGCTEASTRTPLAALYVVGSEAALSVRLFDDQQWRGALSAETRDRALLQEWFDVLTQRASPAFPASTLGL
jgi:hypothetical protein